MNPEIKNKWTAALRSGKYRQGRGWLVQRDNNKHLKHCCLGVLCEVMGAKRIAYSYSYKDSTMANFLAWEMVGPVGIDTSTQNKLSSMNDNKGKTFREIADWIDANL